MVNGLSKEKLEQLEAEPRDGTGDPKQPMASEQRIMDDGVDVFRMMDRSDGKWKHFAAPEESFEMRYGVVSVVGRSGEEGKVFYPKKVQQMCIDSAQQIYWVDRKDILGEVTRSLLAMAGVAKP